MENAYLNLTILVGLLIVVVYRYVHKKFNHWNNMSVVGPKPNLFLGNMTDFIFMRKTPGEIYKEFYHKYRNERFIGAYRIHRLDLILLDLEDIRRVLITDFSHFKDRSELVIEEREPLIGNLFNAKSHLWKPMRQTVSPAFTTGKLRNMVPLILEVGDEFSKYLNVISDTEEETEFREVMAKFTTDVIGSCGFGVKTNSMLDVNAPFRAMGRKLFQMDYSKFIKFFVKINFPSLYTLLKLKLQEREVEGFFVKIVKVIIDERIESGNKRNDFIDLMLELKAKQESEQVNDPDKLKIDETFITSQAFIFFAAGFETSSTLMSFVLHELALNPDIQDKVCEEIESVLGRHNGKMSYEIVSQMTYLDMVVSEAQRKYPALGHLMRICTQAYTFPGSKVKVERGNLIEIPTLAIHYDPKYYPDPDKFIPERFTPEAKRERHPMTYLPFGDGPRNCVGLRLGKIQSIIGLITVLKDFSVEPCSKTVPKVIFNPSSFVTASTHGMWLKLKKRNKSI